MYLITFWEIHTFVLLLYLFIFLLTPFINKTDSSEDLTIFIIVYDIGVMKHFAPPPSPGTYLGPRGLPEFLGQNASINLT